MCYRKEAKEKRGREQEMHGKGAGRCKVRELGGTRGTVSMGARREVREEQEAREPGGTGLRVRVRYKSRGPAPSPRP